MVLVRIFILFLSLCLNPLVLAASVEAPDDELRQLLTQAINDNTSFQDRFEAEVWLMDMSSRLKRYITDDYTRINLLKQVHLEAQRAKLQPELVMAVIHVESRFNQWAISHAGARGLMQVMPFWLNEIGQPGASLFDMRTNLRMGCTILKYYLGKEDGNMTQALARYNGSRGSFVYPNLIYKALRTRWFRR